MGTDSFKTAKYEGAWIPFDGDRARFRASVQEFLRVALSDRDGILVVDERGPHWKGSVTLAGLSYSQTQEWGAVVFSRMHAIGIDVERADRSLKVDYLKLANRFFHADEVAALRKISVLDGASYFLDLWMKKEAYSKMKRQHLVEFISKTIPETVWAESLMKIRQGYRAVVVIE